MRMADQDTAGVAGTGFGGDDPPAPPRGSAALCERFAVADVDSHIIEPADLWTSRLSSKWGDLVPHVRFHERRQEDYWYIGDQVLYPNILGFHSHVFLNNMPPELATECVQAYNDWLVEWSEADSRRLIPMMMLPFWDIDESVAEMRRAYELGHR